MIKKVVLFVVVLIGVFVMDNHKVLGDTMGEYSQNYHLNAKSGFMNDIQSIIFDEKTQEYKFYYLHNQDFNVGGNGTEWEAVSTKDFVHYNSLGTAIKKYTTPNGDIASGTIYKDYDNTLGFGKDALISYVTSYGEKGQTQNIWFSVDNGLTFQAYKNNPIMTPDNKDANFRDPYVFRLDGTFYMYLAEGNKIGVYNSKDGIHFNYKSGIYNKIDQLGLLECPNLFKLKTTDSHEDKWIMLFGGNGYQRQETTGTYYVVGNLIDGVFQPETDARRVDDGSDFYGAKFMQTNDHQLLSLGWLGSWDYNKQVKTNTGKVGSMSMARVLSLTQKNNYHLITNHFLTSTLFKNKVDEQTVYTKETTADALGYKTVVDKNIPLKSFALNLNTVKDNENFPSHIHIEIDNQDSFFKFDLDTTNGYYMVSRDGTNIKNEEGAYDHYAKAHVAKINAVNQLNVQLFVDAGSIEMFFPETGETYSLAKFSEASNNHVTVKVNGDTRIAYSVLE
ncbi:glycoside hydrolase family 32 protein [Leuconostoc rapi]|uniref:glycoside hydrolase family 32 protein n=1 Tax=Leuconostoc rapi TaxID=1406906 RepID=UPI00195E55EF|nr:glycoside hydrolase family 32 protein [Leuconostoc rapi]MBM7436332.1 sucrose-6-phosphate hydrolase SacC (GH32 family) [Leuconostoc rapi]